MQLFRKWVLATELTFFINCFRYFDPSAEVEDFFISPPDITFLIMKPQIFHEHLILNHLSLWNHPLPKKTLQHFKEDILLITHNVYTQNAYSLNA